jgi:hypothetical protein
MLIWAADRQMLRHNFMKTLKPVVVVSHLLAQVTLRFVIMNFL